MCVFLNFVIFVLVVFLLVIFLLERGVKFCFILCREVCVNVSDICEVFVSNCVFVKVEIVGDLWIVMIWDFVGLCGKFKYFY